jgi:hypothetical protein
VEGNIVSDCGKSAGEEAFFPIEDLLARMPEVTYTIGNILTEN